MGVIYSVNDDVKDLLEPFITEKGVIRDQSTIWDVYRSASSGRIPSSKLWEALGLDPEVEDEYLERYELTDGIIDFLKTMKSLGYGVWCLSNDISEWAKKRKARFGLEAYFDGFVISGDVSSRKPDKAIYQHLIRKVGVNPSEMVFVDDILENLSTASELGINAILYSPTTANFISEKHKIARSLKEVLLLLNLLK
jgi:HAD superfamily hydrolase (TIGR01509 family)